MTAPRPTPPVPGTPGGAVAAPADPFAGLADRPVAEHVAVYEAELDRLQRQLSTVDQL